MSKEKLNSRKRRLRRGVAIVELAVVIPLLLVIFLGLINATTLMFAKQSLRIACYEGCRVGIVPGARPDNIQAQVQLILDARRIQDYTIVTTPSDPSTMSRGDFFTVRVTCSTASNLPIPWMGIGLGDMESEVAMMAEF